MAPPLAFGLDPSFRAPRPWTPAQAGAGTAWWGGTYTLSASNVVAVGDMLGRGRSLAPGNSMTLGSGANGRTTYQTASTRYLATAAAGTTFWTVSAAYYMQVFRIDAGGIPTDSATSYLNAGLGNCANFGLFFRNNGGGTPIALVYGWDTADRKNSHSFSYGVFHTIECWHSGGVLSSRLDGAAVPSTTPLGNVINLADVVWMGRSHGAPSQYVTGQWPFFWTDNTNGASYRDTLQAWAKAEFGTP